jgi:hypothetical protein
VEEGALFAGFGVDFVKDLPPFAGEISEMRISCRRE